MKSWTATANENLDTFNIRLCFSESMVFTKSRVRLATALILIECVQHIRAGLNLNFKSQQLTNIFHSRKSPEVQQEVPKKESPDFLRLDLSGRIQVLLAGQETETASTKIIKPIFPWQHSTSNPFVPRNVDVSLDYDFAKSSFGILRLVPGCTFDIPNERPAKAYIPCRLDMALEKGLAAGVENAIETRVWWKPWRHNSYTALEPSCVALRYEDTGHSALSCSLPLHPRVSFEGTLSKNLWGSRTRLAVPKSTTSDEDWWLPDLSISALGRMQANKQIWFGKGSSRWGFRLAVRRQLEWSILNNPSVDQQDAKTYLSVSFQGAASHWRTGARFESTLDEPLEQARLTVSSHLHIASDEPNQP